MALRTSLAPVVVAGLVLLGCSDDGGGDTTPGEPIGLGDHVHEVFGVFACGEWAPPSADVGPDVSGIHGHGDGLIHIHPFGAEFAGDGATLGAFFASVGITADEESIELADGRRFESGDACRPGEPEGEVRLLVDGEEVDGDPADLALARDRTIVLAFGPPGEEVPDPPWVDALQAPSDVAPPVVSDAG